MGEERGRHLVVLRIRGIGMFGNGARGHLAGERGVAGRVAVRAQNNWIAARITTSGSGTRSAVSMTVEARLMRSLP